MRILRALGPSLAVLTLLTVTSCSQTPATLILTNGQVYTMEPHSPWAEAVVISRNTITAVLDQADRAEAYRGPDTRVVDLAGKIVGPGFIDGHVHFNRAGELINDANLMAVSSAEGLRTEIVRVVEILGDGEWITGGLWGAYEQRGLGDAAGGEEERARWLPHRSTIDDLTPANPCLLGTSTASCLSPTASPSRRPAWTSR